MTPFCKTFDLSFQVVARVYKTHEDEWQFIVETYIYEYQEVISTMLEEVEDYGEDGEEAAFVAFDNFNIEDAVRFLDQQLDTLDRLMFERRRSALN